jgi:arsenate reductase
VSVTIYHNPRCSKSRQALGLLTERGLEPQVIDYLKTPPDRKTLEGLLKLLGIGPRELMRKNEPEYRSASLDDPTLSDEQLIAVLLEHPILIERPIVVTNGRAVIGRPPERVLDLLD